MKKIFVLMGIVTMSCAFSKASESPFQQIYVTDFHSDDIEQCKPSDVNLSHHQAREFFLYAKAVAYKVIHDHYKYSPMKEQIASPIAEAFPKQRVRLS